MKKIKNINRVSEKCPDSAQLLIADQTIATRTYLFTSSRLFADYVYLLHIFVGKYERNLIILYIYSLYSRVTKMPPFLTLTRSLGFISRETIVGHKRKPWDIIVTIVMIFFTCKLL